ncbi:uncharacterized protein LOC127278214 [Leptopilina boulardi]|uniref:uncharacterized protein LOC127278214 n=1 Tax=Leptopilina boulardi TaxID=63433 RepID=UPI0021F552B1|nr:uncharacterized protein LOC127278214 [Leptopilina boulardi]
MFDLSHSSSDEAQVDSGHVESDKRKSNRRGRRSNSNFAETNRPSGSDGTRREENPFSFKHFLKNDSQTNYQYAGARPKVYTVHSSNNNSVGHEREAGLYPCNPTELPDFVQDHLVIEQCYVDHDRITSPATDVDNLPDFALNSMERRQNHRHSNDIKKHINDCGEKNFSFDLADNLERRSRNNISTNSLHPDPLDLPNFNSSENASGSDSRNFPLDLQIPPDESNDVLVNGQSNGVSNIVKSLPDFLNDGPIRNTGAVSNDRLDSYANDSTELRLTLENERLNRELEIARRQASERASRIKVLENQLLSRRQEDHEETVNLEKAMEKVEDNLKRSTKRAVLAESMLVVVKKEIVDLTNEISLLRAENRELRAAIEGGCSNCNSSCADGRIKRLASELRTAASTAEVSLRQLMSGVGNLRVLASALENVNRIEDRTKDFLPDSDDDNATGPAL